VVFSAPVAALPTPVGIVAGPRSTVELMSLLSSLRLPIETQARLVAPFPVVGPASYGAPSPTGASPLLSDQGTDIAAVAGSPVVASGSGVVAAGGGTVAITLEDGTVYSYAGLAQVTVTDGSRTAQGDVLGVTGDVGGPHLRFVIRPKGGAGVDAAPYLDRWLAQALGTARAMGGAPLGATELGSPSVKGVTAPASRIRPAASLRRPHSHSSSTGAASTLLVLAGGGWWARRCWRRSTVERKEVANTTGDD
jgi:murein DD-endopeptidase MepM/ murein hydrolase activator NlpD